MAESWLEQAIVSMKQFGGIYRASHARLVTLQGERIMEAVAHV